MKYSFIEQICYTCHNNNCKDYESSSSENVAGKLVDKKLLDTLNRLFGGVWNSTLASCTAFQNAHFD